MCRIWDWQATIVRDLNDSQDPKHMLYCRIVGCTFGIVTLYFIFVADAADIVRGEKVPCGAILLHMKIFDGHVDQNCFT